jgi:hypothetical protein
MYMILTTYFAIKALQPPANLVYIQRFKQKTDMYDEHIYFLFGVV